MTASAQSRGKSGVPSHIVMLLSLELILLAFFILLNGLSEFEQQKQAQVLDSVTKAFRGSIQTPANVSELPPSLGVLGLPQGLTEEIGSLFESFVPEAKAKRTEHATAMFVEMPVSAFFRVGEDDIRPERKVLIRRVARAMMRDPDGVLSYELAFEHGVVANQPGDPTGTARAVRRAAAMARYLIQQSIPSEVVSVGVSPGDPEQVRFVLRLRSDSGSTVPDTGAER
jgi:hypothetical protein